MSDLNFRLQLSGPEGLAFAPIFPRQSIRMSDQGIRVIAAVVDADGNPVNVRVATVKTIKLLKPSGTTFDVAASLFTNGYDGKVYFTSTALLPPFNQVGEWWVQVKVTIGGNTQHTQWANFAVGPNIDLN